MAVLRGAVDVLDTPCSTDAARIDQLTTIEAAKSALAAMEVLGTVQFAASQHAEQERLGVPARHQGRGVAEQIGLATRRAPATASRRLAEAQTLVTQMPATLAALAAGRVSEFGAAVAVRETACLTGADRAEVDAELGPVVDHLSVRQIEHAVRRRVIELDQAAVVRRAARARADRYVSLRPAPDCMTRISALLPVEQGVAVYASLRREAESLRGAGDERAKAQIMADTLVTRTTGQATVAAVPVEIAMVMTSDALLGQTETPAQLPGHGPIPARLARQIATGPEPDTTGPESGQDQVSRNAVWAARAWIRRVLTDPVDGTVTSIDTRRRRFSGALATFIRLRDQNCRDLYCDAPIRDLDHLHGYAGGGSTTAANGQGLCQRDNLVRELPGWTTTGTGNHRVTTTPTGHTYTSRPPPALGVSLRARPAPTPAARSA